MTTKKQTYTARASLMERLVDLSPKTPKESVPLMTLNRKELKDSILQNLEWLLNTRTTRPQEELDKKDMTVIDYGIPDLGAFSPVNPEHRIRLGKMIKRAIDAFEPRLQNITVYVEPEKKNERTLKVIIINASMIVETVREPVTFKTILQG